MNIEHALTVEGWMTEAELAYLAGVASKCSHIAEVGSWKGRSTCALAANTKYDVLCVDTWKGSREHGIVNPEELFTQFLANTQQYDWRVKWQKMTSLEAAALLGDESFDMIFLDASHDYQSVKADILAWTPLLTKGGILCGHDYDPPNWMGVKQAVEECVPGFRIVPGTTIWTTEIA